MNPSLLLPPLIRSDCTAFPIFLYDRDQGFRSFQPCKDIYNQPHTGYEDRHILKEGVTLRAAAPPLDGNQHWKHHQWEKHPQQLDSLNTLTLKDGYLRQWDARCWTVPQAALSASCWHGCLGAPRPGLPLVHSSSFPVTSFSSLRRKFT